MRKMKRFMTAVMLLVLVLAFGMQTSAATKTYTMYVGRNYKIKQSGVKKWTSSNKKIATVGSKNGKIKPKKPGTVTIKAKKKKKTTVKFQVIVKKPYINKTKLTLEKGKSSTLKLTGTTAKSWKSSKSSVVSVSSKGVIKAKVAGTATITVRGSNKKTYQCRVTVPKPYVPPKQPEPTPEPAPQPETEPQMPEPGPFTGYMIMHRGYNKVAPENTLSAFKLAAEMGYKSVECDIQFTKDGVPVIIHDTTVNRTSNVASVEMELFGEKKRKLSELTFEEVRKLDFGSWKAAAYAGEQIPTFQEFLQLCQQYGLHPYIELKSNGNYSSKLSQLYSIVAALGMQNQVTWISFDINLLNSMKKICPTAELGWLRSNGINPSTIAGARAIQLPTNKVYLMPYVYNLSYEMLKECWKYNIGLIAQSVNSQETKNYLNSYYTAALTNGF
ncbi:Ig-like domain-containing protein [Lacrimispora saccharolytica]|nr:Ig-like domain-containing protein [Lacrimispora saccharolytica]